MDGQTVCTNCGTLISDSVIVNEISYGEATSGAAIVQGTTVHEGQRYAKSAGTNFRRGGRTAEDHAEAALREGRDELTRLADALKIPEVVDTAFSYYTLARIHQFHRPRRENAAICLYIACRQKAGNTTMLIDFAELINCNVFDLGATYKQFLKTISLEDEIESIPLIEIEPLIMKYAQKLEFGSYTKLVANDAAAILSRMNRDWIISGRQPAGLCGACLILAARMNNFRRSVREVVYVVKAGEVSIHRRLEEFRRTKAGRMTVQQFRDFSKRLKDTAEPPVVWEARQKEERKRKRELWRNTPRDTDSPSQEREVLPTPRSSRRPRKDAEGFLIPDLPIDPSLASSSHADSVSTDAASEHNEEENRPRKRRKKEKPAPISITEDDLLPEDPDLETEISNIVTTHLHENETAYDISFARAKMIANSELEREYQEKLRRKYASWRNPVAETVHINEDEFEDDPEVANCRLSEREIEVKEKIWVSYNADYLRKAQEKQLDKMMLEAMGKDRAKKRGREGIGKGKRPRRGDGSVLGDSPAASPAEASQRMIEKRANRAVFSRHLNYEKLKRIYAPSTTSGATSEAAESVSGESWKGVSPAPGEEEVVEIEEMADESERAAQRNAGASSKDNPIEISEDESSEVSSDSEIEAGEPPATGGTRQHFEDDYDEDIVEEDEDVDYDELGLQDEV